MFLAGARTNLPGLPRKHAGFTRIYQQTCYDQSEFFDIDDAEAAEAFEAPELLL